MSSQSLLWSTCQSYIVLVTDDGNEVILRKGEAVKVVRASEKRGYLVVEHRNTTLDLPFQVMELKVCIALFFKCRPLYIIFAWNYLQPHFFRNESPSPYISTARYFNGTGRL